MWDTFLLMRWQSILVSASLKKFIASLKGLGKTPWCQELSSLISYKPRFNDVSIDILLSFEQLDHLWLFNARVIHPSWSWNIPPQMFLPTDISPCEQSHPVSQWHHIPSSPSLSHPVPCPCQQISAQVKGGVDKPYLEVVEESEVTGLFGGFLHGLGQFNSSSATLCPVGTNDCIICSCFTRHLLDKFQLWLCVGALNDGPNYIKAEYRVYKIYNKP